MRPIEDILEDIGIDQLSPTPNGFKGCCKINPKHIDRKPSMHIHLKKGLVKCFSCGKFKPLFTFLLDEGIPFDEAIGFMFTDYEYKKNSPKGMQEWILGRKIPKSMLDRGITIGTLNYFGVGYDEAEHRITIPLRYKGILYGIKYREYPKVFYYSEGFIKDNYIYNYEPTEDRFYVEGETDTWKVWQNGTKNVSSTLSANPSEGQLELMKVHKRIFLAYDKDKAGIRGAFTINKAIGREVEIFMIPYKSDDPGNCTLDEWAIGAKKPITFTEFEVMLIGKNQELYNELKK